MYLAEDEHKDLGSISLISIAYNGPAFDPWKYDVNGSCYIDKDEAIKALQDYYDGHITEEQAEMVANLYDKGTVKPGCTPTPPSDIVLDRFTVYPNRVGIGDTVHFHCRATNQSPSGVASSRHVDLFIDGVVAHSWEVSLSWAEEKYLEHSQVVSEMGVHNVAIDGLISSFEVVGAQVNYLDFSGLELVGNFFTIANNWRSHQIEVARCPFCGEEVVMQCVDGGIDYIGGVWRDHIYGHYAYSEGWNWVEFYAPPGITHEEYLAYRSPHPEDVIQQAVCLPSGCSYTLNADPSLMDFNVVEVHDIGFDGQWAWYDIETRQKGAAWNVQLVAIPEEEYEAFLADIMSTDRMCNYQGCGLNLKQDWQSYQSCLSKLIMSPQDRIAYGCNPRIPPGNYYILLHAAYHGEGYFGSPHWHIPWCKVWRVGSVRF